jgi:nicotinate phosphoribosyltransferase
VHFTGAVHAMPEGTPFFANEPILRVTALPNCQGLNCPPLRQTRQH